MVYDEIKELSSIIFNSGNDTIRIYSDEDEVNINHSGKHIYIKKGGRIDINIEYVGFGFNIDDLVKLNRLCQSLILENIVESLTMEEG